MIRFLLPLALVLLSTLLISCRTRDIRPAAVKGAIPAEATARAAALLPAYPAGLANATVEYVISDNWKSGFVRRFTPLYENETTLKVKITASSEIDAEFLSGDHKGMHIGIRDGKTYRIRDGVFEWRKKNSVKTYLESLRLYLQFLPRVAALPARMPAGEAYVAGERFELMYASRDFDVSREHDQFLLYLQTGRDLALGEFTYREVLRNYRGFIKLRQYTDFAGTRMPAVISIEEKAAADSAVHTITIREFRHLSSAPN